MERMHEDFDEEASELIDRGVNPISFPGLKTAVTSDDSKAINFNERPKVIISASGMCDAGRIKHHLKHNLWRPESTILFVGYRSVGTLGRALVEGAQKVKLFGEESEVRAEIRVLAGVSGHADKDSLLTWISAFEQKPRQVFVVHGEDSSCTLFSERVKKSLASRRWRPTAARFMILPPADFSGKRRRCGYRRRLLRPEAVRIRYSTGCLRRDSVCLRLSGTMRAEQIKIWRNLPIRLMHYVINGRDKLMTRLLLIINRNPERNDPQQPFRDNRCLYQGRL